MFKTTKLNKIGIFLFFLVLSIIFFGGCSCITSSQAKLDEIRNVSYDENKLCFVWDAVEKENADINYLVSINGEEITQQKENNYFYIPTKDKTIEFKVKAIDFYGNYDSSEWSETYTYSVQESENIYFSTYTYVETMLTNGANLKKIISIYPIDIYVYIQVLAEKNGVDYLYNFEVVYASKVESLTQALKTDYRSRILTPIGNAGRYDSASYLLQSDDLGPTLQEYKDHGYSISIANSGVAMSRGADKGEEFWIYGAYKLEKADETKYYSVNHRISIKNPSDLDFENFTKKILHNEGRSLREYVSIELTGDFVEFVEKSMQNK